MLGAFQSSDQPSGHGTGRRGELESQATDRWLEGVVSGVRLDVTGALHGLVGAGRPGAFGRSGVPEDEMNLALTTCKPSAIRCRTQDWRWDMVMAQRVAVRVGCKLVPHSAIP